MSTTRKHNIVALDSWVRPPDFDLNYEFTQHETTSLEELPERIKDATIIIISGTKINRTGIESAPNLELIACNGVGTDHIDKETAQQRGVTVCRVPAQNTDSVSEHALALYYSIRRRVVEMHNIAMDGKTWPGHNMIAKKLGQPPRTNGEEKVVVIGYGALGRNIEKMCKALGMEVLIADRKGATTVREGRVAFDDAIKQGTVFMVVTPLDNDTRDMINTSEFEAMDPTALIINVGRGGVINEPALAQALKDGQIGGAGTDVFDTEPATKENCPLLDETIPNLIVSPHVAWYSSRTFVNTRAMVKANVEGYVNGKPQNIVVAGKGCQ